MCSLPRSKILGVKCHVLPSARDAHFKGEKCNEESGSFSLELTVRTVPLAQWLTNPQLALTFIMTLIVYLAHTCSHSLSAPSHHH